MWRGSESNYLGRGPGNMLSNEKLPTEKRALRVAISKAASGRGGKIEADGSPGPGSYTRYESSIPRREIGRSPKGTMGRASRDLPFVKYAK